ARSSRRVPVATGLGSTVTSMVLVCLAAGAALLGYIRLKAELGRLEMEIGAVDRELMARRRSNEKLRADYEALVSSDGLNRRIIAMNLDLVMPGENARVVLSEPAVEIDTAAAPVR